VPPPVAGPVPQPSLTAADTFNPLAPAATDAIGELHENMLELCVRALTREATAPLIQKFVRVPLARLFLLAVLV
jgi:hypothetical protein